LIQWYQNALDSFYGIKGGNLSFGPPPERGQDGKAKRETLSSFLQRGVEDDMELAGGYMDYMPMNDTNQLISGSFNMPINPDAFNQDRKLRKIYEKGKSTTNPYEKEIFLKKAGPQLFPKVQGLPGGVQGPAQGPNTLIRKYGGQYMPYGPGGGGLPPTPIASMFGGPQIFSDPMTIKTVS
jgi:hypothetical protein